MKFAELDIRLLTVDSYPTIQNSKRHTQDLGDGYDYATFSVTEETDLTKFFLTAEMNNKQFQSGTTSFGALSLFMIKSHCC